MTGVNKVKAEVASNPEFLAQEIVVRDYYRPKEILLLQKAKKQKKYKELMRTALVYDGRNIYDVEEMKKENVEYYSIGR